ncbi:MAG: hypothetical protein ACREC1_06105, partial [Methylovirgula sp.]
LRTSAAMKSPEWSHRHRARRPVDLEAFFRSDPRRSPHRIGRRATPHWKLARNPKSIVRLRR